jgi:L-alanine-DL-glutamate epimerase-like enolase superfamily enzyme
VRDSEGLGTSISSSSRWTADDLRGHGHRAPAATDIAIGADEGIHSLDDIRPSPRAQRPRAACSSARRSSWRGPRSEQRPRRLCDRLGMSVNIACNDGENQSVALCSGAPRRNPSSANIAVALTLTHVGVADDVAVSAIPTAGGHVDILDRPGLGVDVDEDRSASPRGDRNAERGVSPNVMAGLDEQVTSCPGLTRHP